jgi:hypothetical protein
MLRSSRRASSKRSALQAARRHWLLLNRGQRLRMLAKNGRHRERRRKT